MMPGDVPSVIYCSACTLLNARPLLDDESRSCCKKIKGVRRRNDLDQSDALRLS